MPFRSEADIAFVTRRQVSSSPNTNSQTGTEELHMAGFNVTKLATRQQAALAPTAGDKQDTGKLSESGRTVLCISCFTERSVRYFGPAGRRRMPSVAEQPWVTDQAASKDQR